MFGAKDLSNPLRNEKDIILNAFDAKNPGKPSETLESYNSERIWCKEPVKTFEKWAKDKIMNVSDAMNPSKPSEKLERYNSERIWCKGPVKTYEKWERYHSECIWCIELSKPLRKEKTIKLWTRLKQSTPANPLRN